MHSKTPIATIQPTLTSIFLALVSVGITLSTLYIESIAIKTALLVAAALLLAATGASLAIVLARPQPSAGQ